MRVIINKKDQKEILKYGIKGTIKEYIEDEVLINFIIVHHRAKSLFVKCDGHIYLCKMVDNEITMFVQMF